jgi:RimJ/RimL family protein N-acetyltransferase
METKTLDQELMALHIQALFTHDAHSRLLCINEPGGGDIAPRLFLGRTRTGNLWRFRADLPESLIEELEALCVDEPVGQEFPQGPRHFEAYLRFLETHAPVQKWWMGPAYHFTQYLEPSRPLLAITEANAEKLRGGFEELIVELPDWQPFLALIEEGQAVSVCRSVRIIPEAHEAGVETLPDFRGKGYAKEVVAGWARLVHAMGAMPLYSTSWENTASQAVAKKLRLVPYGADFHVT